MGREGKNGWEGEVLRTWGWNREAAFLGVLRWESPGGSVGEMGRCVICDKRV